MDQSMQELISQYGYALMALGALMEGETFLIAGGIAAKHGLLSVPWLIALAWVGSTIHDLVCFFFGRYAGTWLLRKRPAWQMKVEKTYRIFSKYGLWTVIFMRFLYGFRIIIPVSLGTTSIPVGKFVMYDVIGGLLWSATFIIGGYIFGEALDVALHKMVEYHYWIGYILAGFIVLCVICLVLWLWWRKRKNQ